MTRLATDTLANRHTLLKTHFATDTLANRHTLLQAHIATDTLYLEDIWHHASSVSQSILLAHPVANQLLVLGVVKGGPQVSG